MLTIKCVRINNLRSIKRCSLDCVPGLNMLIGRNGSGKSNIIRAVDAFFDTIRQGRFATPKPMVGDAVDVHKQARQVASVIEVELIFAVKGELAAELQTATMTKAGGGTGHPKRAASHRRK